MTTNVTFRRTVKFYSVDGERFYQIDDEMIGNPNSVENHTYWSFWHGAGYSGDNTFDFNSTDKRAVWDGQCTADDDPRIEVLYMDLCNLSATLDFHQLSSLYKTSTEKGEYDDYTILITKVSDAWHYHMRTLLKPTYCNEDTYIAYKPVSTNGGGGSKINPSSPNKTGANLWTDLNLRDFVNVFDRWTGDTLQTDAKDLWIVLNTNIPTTACSMNGFIHHYYLDSGKNVILNDTQLFKSNFIITDFGFEYYDKFNYKGRLTVSDSNDTVSLYLPDVPNPLYSDMVET
ncbi:MAG: hypothetical protein KDC92_15875, partial [Bacteroidetes bacterium]|nr:hypothetical protein [Bacteroidota bacterium]